MVDVLGGISSPLIESAIVGAVGIATITFKRWRTGLALIACAAAWAYLCATPAFTLLLWNGLANQYPPEPVAGYPHADAIVLVGGGSLPDPLATWNAAADPALSTPLGFTLALYRAGKADHIVISAGPGNTESLVDALVRQGVPERALLSTSKSHSTYEDSKFSAPLLYQVHARKILLVSYAAHMPRTVAVFRPRRFRVIPAPALEAPHRATGVGWTPNRANYWSARAWLHEYIGLWYYRLRGWAAW